MNESMPVPGAQRLRRKNAVRPWSRLALCWAFGLFALSQAGLGLWIPRDGYLVRDTIRRDRLRTLRQRIAEAPAPPKFVVLLGSSHIKDGVLSRQLGLQASDALGRPVVVANQAFAGGGPVRSLLAMDRLLREDIAPDLVVLETFPILFDDRCDETGGDVLPISSLDAGDVALLRRYAVDRPDLEEGRYLESVAPVHAQRSNLTNFLMPWLLVPDRRKRPEPEEAEFRDEDHSPARRAKLVAQAKDGYYPRLQDLPLDGIRQRKAVTELVERLRAEGAKVVFLATPEGPAFRSWYPPGSWPKSVAWLRDLAARHGVPLFDAREWTDDEELFGDSHHLAKAGAERFTRWLGSEVLVPQLREAE
jgi:hypothetical protein